ISLPIICFTILRIFDGDLYDPLSAVYVTTSAKETEQSWSIFCDDTDIDVCLASEYAYAWIGDSEYRDLKTCTLDQQYEEVKKTTVNSHVMKYGEMAMGSLPVGKFQGHYDLPMLGIHGTMRPNAVDRQPASLARSLSNSRRLMEATTEQENETAWRKLQRSTKLGQIIKETVRDIVRDVTNRHKSTLKGLSKRDELMCFQAVFDQFRAHCFTIQQVGLTSEVRTQALAYVTSKCTHPWRYISRAPGPKLRPDKSPADDLYGRNFRGKSGTHITSTSVLFLKLDLNPARSCSLVQQFVGCFQSQCDFITSLEVRRQPTSGFALLGAHQVGEVPDEGVTGGRRRPKLAIADIHYVCRWIVARRTLNLSEINDPNVHRLDQVHVDLQANEIAYHRSSRFNTFIAIFVLLLILSVHTLYVTTSAKENEQSWSILCEDKDIDVCLASEYRCAWIADSECEVSQLESSNVIMIYLCTEMTEQY
ncbi:hypothetical protein T265_15297, partial [Opisthorchis viverrini]